MGIDVPEQIGRVERCLEEIEGDDRALRAVQAIVELYGEAFRRIGARVPLEQLVDDELLQHLLLVHDLHPVELETRVLRALDEVRPFLGSHGGGVELLSLDDGVAHVRLNGTCDGCASSAVTLTHAIEKAILEAAPELERVDAEGVAEAQPKLLQIGALTCPAELQA